MMMMLLLYAYCVGTVSSRKIERACYEDLAFRVLTGNQQPDHSRISEFRRRNLDALKGLFVQILLMDVIQRLVDKGNSVLVIEHNLDVIRCSDWIIDLGPEGGDKGGQIVVTGTPEEVAEHPTSHTGRYLKQVLEQHPPQTLAA
jgi:hypothetical protein